MTQPDLLKPLVDAIETVKRRIELYRGSLKEDEIRTRVALIDPVLRALGWDVSDPRMVTPEYNVRGHKPDYGLHKPVGDPNDDETVGDLVAILEAKRLEERLQNHYAQMTADAENAKLNYAGITDGDNWELYKFEGGGLRKEWTPVMQVRLMGVPTHAAAIKLLVLWRPNLASGQLLEAETSIVRLPVHNDPPTSEPDETNGAAIKERQREAGLKAAETRRRRNAHGGNVALSDPAAGDSVPDRIRFPDGTEIELGSWQTILTETADWLARTGRIPPDGGPYRAPGVNIVTQQPSGGRYHKIKSRTLYLNINLRADESVTRAKNLLEYFSVDPSTVYLVLE